ncbi:MAG: flippase-like domain-containing protein [Candidatus Coatesbacteria bacterium]|nr:flippase-like domain-containing protein [Candidatus Coatesbacteria bacterium]
MKKDWLALKDNSIITPGRIRSAIYTILFALIIYLSITIYIGADKMWLAIRSFPVITHLIPLILIVFIGWFLRAIRWNIFLHTAQENKVPALKSYWIFFASFSLTITPGKAGEIVKAAFLKDKYSIPVTKTAGILMIERIMDLLSIIVLAAFSFPFFLSMSINSNDSYNIILSFIISSIIVAGFVLFIFFEGIYTPVLNYIGKIPFLSKLCLKILELLKTGKDLLNLKTILKGMVLSITSWGLEAVAFYWIMNGMKINGSLELANFAYSIGQIIGAVTLTPGGVGTVETGMFVPLKIAGIKPADAAPAILLLRIVTLWLASFTGFCFIIPLMKGFSAKNEQENTAN